MEPGRAFHPPATSRDGAGHLRRRVDRRPRAMARHERARRRARTGRRFRCRRRRKRRQRPRRRRAAAAPFGERRWRQAAARRQPRADPFAEEPARSRPAVRVLRRRRDPDSVGAADAAPASPTSSSATRRTPSTSGSSIWPARLRCSSPARAARTSRPTTRAMLTGVASYDQGEWSVIFKRPLRPASGARVHAGRVPAHRLLGLGRVLARARQPARSHALVLRLRRAAGRPVGRRPDDAGRR